MLCPHIIEDLIRICVKPGNLLLVFSWDHIPVVVAHEHQTGYRKLDLVNPDLYKVLEIFNAIPVLSHILSHGLVDVIHR